MAETVNVIDSGTLEIVTTMSARKTRSDLEGLLAHLEGNLSRLETRIAKIKAYLKLLPKKI